MKKNEGIRNIFIGIFAAIIFLVLFLGLHWNFFLSALLSIVLFIGACLAMKPRIKIGNTCIEGMKDAAKLEQKFLDAKEDFKAITYSIHQIKDNELREQARLLHQTANHILCYLEEHPEKITEAESFIDYYQDTASSILTTYVTLQNSKLETEEVRKLKDDTYKAVIYLNEAFARQFERLMNNELVDMSAEIEQIQNTMDIREIFQETSDMYKEGVLS